jgi:carbonic anhydrase
MGMHYNPQLWQSLPAKAEFEFQDRNDIRDLDVAIRSLGLKLLETEDNGLKRELQLQQRRLLTERDRLYREELKKIQMSQTQKPTDSEENSGSIYEQTLFYYRRRVMPQRDILADLLPRRLGLRHPDGRNALAALESLCEETDSTAYRNSLRPQNGSCLCGKPIAEFVLNCWKKISLKANILFHPGSWLTEGGCTSTDVIKPTNYSSIR